MTRPGRPSRNRRPLNELVIISWRDIPAQVTGRDGDERHQVMLAHRFQKAIDRAAMVADKKTAQDYVGEWQRRTAPYEGSLVDAVDAYASQLDADYPNDRLHLLVNNGGWDPDRPQPDPQADPQAGPQPEPQPETDTVANEELP